MVKDSNNVNTSMLAMLVDRIKTHKRMRAMKIIEANSYQVGRSLNDVLADCINLKHYLSLVFCTNLIMRFSCIKRETTNYQNEKQKHSGLNI